MLATPVKEVSRAFLTAVFDSWLGGGCWVLATPVEEVSRAFLSADGETPCMVFDFLVDDGPGLLAGDD